MLDERTTATTAANHTTHPEGTVGTASSGQERIPRKQGFDSFPRIDNHYYAGCSDTHQEAGTTDIPPSREKRRGERKGTRREKRRT